MAPFTIIPIDQLDASVGQKGVTDLDEFVGPSGQDGAVPTIDALGVITWDETFLKAGDDLDLLKGPSGQDEFIPILNSTGDISFTDQYTAPGDQVTDLIATPTEVGKFISVDGAGNLIFLPIGTSSFLAITVGAAGDFATFAEALDDIALNASTTFGFIVILEQVNWGTPAQTLNKPIIVQGFATDSEIVINTDDVATVDLGAADGLALMEFRTLTITRDSSSAGGFDFTAHDAKILLKGVTIDDNTTDAAAQGIFDGDGENLTVEMVGTTITGTATMGAGIFSRWASANIKMDTTKVLTSAVDLLNNVTSAELLLDNYTILNDPGLTSSTLNVRYASNSLMINTGGGTISEVSGEASYNKAFDAIAGVDWTVALDDFVGPEIRIHEGTFTSTTGNVVVSQTGRVVGAGLDKTFLSSSASTGTRVFGIQGANSCLEDLSIVSSALAATPTRVFEIISGSTNALIKNIRIDLQTDSDTSNMMAFINADNARFIDCEFVNSGDAGLENGLSPQAAVNRLEFHRCSFLHTGAAKSGGTTWIVGNALPVSSVLTITECFLDMGVDTSTGNIFINVGGADSSINLKDNILKGNMRAFLQDATLSNSIIQGNQCDFSQGGAAATSALSLSGVIDSVLISNNTFLNCSHRCIDINSGSSSATKIIISDNIISGAGGSVLEGIRLNGDVSQSKIKDNIIDGFSTGLLTAVSTGTPDDNQYNGNDLVGNTTPITLAAGDTSEVSHNVEV